MGSNVIRNWSLLLLSAILFATAGCSGGKVVVMPNNAVPAAPAVVAPAGTVVTTIPQAPAPPAEEAVGVSPGANYVWVKGYYNWSGNHYVWVPGAWVMAPRPAAVWVEGTWQPTSGGYVWVPGHWR